MTGSRGVAGVTFTAFGTTSGVWVTDASRLASAAVVVQRWFAVVENACSRFRSDSDLSRANAGAGRPVAVCPELVEATEAACRMAELTAGWYDPTVGRAVINAGYDRTFAALERDGAGRLGPPAPGGRWREIRCDPVASTITVPAGTALDLGGSAKGWAVDEALRRVRSALGDDASRVGFCVSAGGDLAVAGPAPAEGWPVRLGESLDGDAAAADAWIGLRDGAVATSGATRRSWQVEGQSLHHLIDPKSGRPGSGRWLLATVHAPSCLVADAAATAVWLMGDDAPAWIERHGLVARLVARPGDARWIGPKTATLRVLAEPRQ